MTGGVTIRIICDSRACVGEMGARSHPGGGRGHALTPGVEGDVVERRVHVGGVRVGLWFRT